MSGFVTLEEAIRHLRIDDDIDSEGNPDLELKIYAASQAIIDYLGDGAADFVDSDGDVIIMSDGESIAPYTVKAATLYLLGILYRHRDESPEGLFKDGNLPHPVKALINPLREIPIG